MVAGRVGVVLCGARAEVGDDGEQVVEEGFDAVGIFRGEVGVVGKFEEREVEVVHGVGGEK